ncbi:hypothetical protein VNO77_22758 [Canavalia gladiata]|uniref:Uncharacterized protein n=1 Tax=Canavalia gladiata TaxID=3824 RepID=A0AAN9L6L9_CANGL
MEEGPTVRVGRPPNWHGFAFARERLVARQRCVIKREGLCELLTISTVPGRGRESEPSRYYLVQSVLGVLLGLRSTTDLNDAKACTELILLVWYWIWTSNDNSLARRKSNPPPRGFESNRLEISEEKLSLFLLSLPLKPFLSLKKPPEPPYYPPYISNFPFS